MWIGLEPGEHSAATVGIHEHPRGGWRIRWSARLYTGRLVSRETRSAKLSKSALRKRAIQQAEALIQASRGDFDSQAWKRSSSLSDYIDTVVIPALSDARLAQNSINRYTTALRHLSAAFMGFSIGDALRPVTIERVLNEIAADHGTATAKGAKVVLSRRIAVPLMKAGVIDSNPVHGTGIEITVEHRAKSQPGGGVSLPRDEYEKAITYLLTAETDLPEFDKRTRWRQVRLRERIILGTLLQAVTGLRINEMRTLKKSAIEDVDSQILITITSDVSKTNKSRQIPVLDPLVAQRLRERLSQLQNDDDFIFDSPGAPGRAWEKRNCQRAMTNFLREELADATNSEALRTHSTHIWRATLNTRAIDAGIPAEIRSAFFGHTETVNRQSYTGSVDVSPMTKILSK